MPTLFRRHVALPTDHGSWVFLLGPLLVGLAAGGALRPAAAYLVVAALAAFLIRQPLTVLVKIRSGRRSRESLPAATFWSVAYVAVAAAGAAGLVASGYGYLLVLAVPGLPVFAWYLALVGRREERRQWAVEVLGCAALALAAPAAYWVGRGGADPRGWLLWLLMWAQSAAAIDYAYLRLEQRTRQRPLTAARRLRLGRRPLLIATANALGVLGLGLAAIVPVGLVLPYAVQLAETAWAAWNPAHGVKPRRIGFRALAVSVVFTLLFVLLWTA